MSTFTNFTVTVLFADFSTGKHLSGIAQTLRTLLGMRSRCWCCEMHIGVPLIPSKTMLIRCSMEQSTTIIVPEPLYIIELPLWRQKSSVSRESWQGFLGETSPQKPKYQSHQHLQALKTRCTCMIGWARLLYIIWCLVLLQMIKKSCTPSLDYMLTPAHIWSHTMIRYKQDKVLDPRVTLSRNSKIFTDKEMTRREQRRN